MCVCVCARVGVGEDEVKKLLRSFRENLNDKIYIVFTTNIKFYKIVIGTF